MFAGESSDTKVSYKVVRNGFRPVEASAPDERGRLDMLQNLFGFFWGGFQLKPKGTPLFGGTHLNHAFLFGLP